MKENEAREMGVDRQQRSPAGLEPGIFQLHGHLLTSSPRTPKNRLTCSDWQIGKMRP